MIYEYNNINTEPNLNTVEINNNKISGIHYDVENSEMTNKTIIYCRWDESIMYLCIYFTEELNEADKTILDGIVENNI